MNLEAYLISKKIDAAAFSKAEPEVWNTWSVEFESMHPNSFTVQKLYLINPIRRKYPLKSELVKSEESRAERGSTTLPNSIPAENSTDQIPPKPKPSIPKPIFKHKPKIS